MSDTTRSSATLPVVRHPIHALLVPVPVVCFTGALLTDVVYSQSSDIQWANFSAWLLFVGITFAVLAGVVGMIDFRRHRGIRRQTPAWPHVIGNVVVIFLALFNNFVHSRDAWTSVVPAGLILSALTVVAMIGTVILGRSIRYALPSGEPR